MAINIERVPEEVRKLVRERYEAGDHVKKIARALAKIGYKGVRGRGVSHPFVSQLARAMGCPPRQVRYKKREFAGAGQISMDLRGADPATDACQEVHQVMNSRLGADLKLKIVGLLTGKRSQ